MQPRGETRYADCLDAFVAAIGDMRTQAREACPTVQQSTEMTMINLNHIDVEKIARSCGLQKSRALSGGIYLCSEDALRAFAQAVVSEAAEQEAAGASLHMLPDSRMGRVAAAS